MKVKDFKNEVFAYCNHMIVSGDTEMPFEAWACDEIKAGIDDEIKNSITYNAQALAEAVLMGGV